MQRRYAELPRMISSTGDTYEHALESGRCTLMLYIVPRPPNNFPKKYTLRSGPATCFAHQKPIYYGYHCAKVNHDLCLDCHWELSRKPNYNAALYEPFGTDPCT